MCKGFEAITSGNFVSYGDATLADGLDMHMLCGICDATVPFTTSQYLQLAEHLAICLKAPVVSTCWSRHLKVTFEAKLGRWVQVQTHLTHNKISIPYIHTYTYS